MNSRIELIAILGSVAIAFSIFELIRKGKLQEKYSLLWFGSTIILIVLSIWRDLLERIAAMLGVFYAPSALFLIAVFFGMLLALHFTIVISRLSEQNKKLAQELGLLGNAFRKLETQLKESK
ncbi:MAG: DUF2304 domain-containing protein [bacterium]